MEKGKSRGRGRGGGIIYMKGFRVKEEWRMCAWSHNHLVDYMEFNQDIHNGACYIDDNHPPAKATIDMIAINVDYNKRTQ